MTTLLTESCNYLKTNKKQTCKTFSQGKVLLYALFRHGRKYLWKRPKIFWPQGHGGSYEEPFLPSIVKGYQKDKSSNLSVCHLLTIHLLSFCHPFWVFTSGYLHHKSQNFQPQTFLRNLFPSYPFRAYFPILFWIVLGAKPPMQTTLSVRSSVCISVRYVAVNSLNKFYEQSYFLLFAL